jgi:hypothetical protein
MKLAKLFLIAFCICAISSFANENWTRTHFISAGFGAAITQGDLEGEKSLLAKDAGKEETIFLPNLGSFLMPEFEIGANLNQHTVSLDFSFSSPKTNFAKGTNLVEETETDILRLGLGYRYNFLWPEPFQIFVGLNYSFMHLKTTNNAFFIDENDNTKRSDATLMGNGFSINSGLLYFIHKNISMELHARFKTMFFSNVSSEENGTCEMDEAQIQFMEEVFLRFSFHF